MIYFKRLNSLVVALVFLISANACVVVNQFRQTCCTVCSSYTGADIGNGYFLWSTSAEYIMVLKHEPADGHPNNKTIVPEKVTRLGFDETWLIVERQELTPRYENGLQKPIKEKTSFYVINLESDTVIGPLDEKNFIQTVERLNIPSKIELRESDDYKNEECSSCL